MKYYRSFKDEKIEAQELQLPNVRGMEDPFGEVKRRVREEASDWLVGCARIVEPVKPEHEAAHGPAMGWGLGG